MSSGLKTFLSTFASWAVLAACAWGTVAYYTELKGVMAASLGFELPADTEILAATGPAPFRAGASGTVIEIRAGRGGHFVTTAEINGSPTEVLVDTGASVVALTWADAERAGLRVSPKDFTGRVVTANGSAGVAPVIIDRLSIGDITVHNVPASVSEPGKLSTTLLGMTFLTRLSRSEIRSGTLVLEQ